MSAADIPSIDWPMIDPARDAMRRRARHALLAADLFLPVDGRLRDDDRATIAGLLTALVEQGERSLRAGLARLVADRPPLAATLAAPDVLVALPILEQAGVLRDPTLVAVLALWAGGMRLIARLDRARDRAAGIEPAPPSPTATFADHADPAVAAAARALAAAGRPDTKQAPGDGGFLPAEVYRRLVWRIAAALRDDLIARHGLAGTEIDAPLAHAAGAMIAARDGRAMPGAPALALADALARAGRLDAALAAPALAAGEAGLAAALLARHGGIAHATTWEMMLDPDPARLLLLCRAIDLPAAAAAAIALHLADGEDDEILADRIEAYAGPTPQRAAAAIGLWRLDPAYLDAIAGLAAGTQP